MEEAGDLVGGAGGGAIGEASGLAGRRGVPGRRVVHRLESSVGKSSSKPGTGLRWAEFESAMGSVGTTQLGA